MQSQTIIPRRIKQITEYLVRLYMDNSNSSMPPPVIIKGQSGTGRSWVINLIKQQLKNDKELYNACVIEVPMQLGAKNLVKNIVGEISSSHSALLSSKPSRGKPVKKIVLLIDNIDRLLNIEQGEQSSILPEKPIKTKNPKSKGAFGIGAAKFHHIRDVSEFRSFLIENSSRITVIASSSEDTTFMEDPDQPFFQFFNLIELKLFSTGELKDFIEETGGEHKEIIYQLDNINHDWPSVLAEGRITYAKFIVDALNEVKNDSIRQLEGEELIRRVILLYFGRISTQFDSLVRDLSYTEKKLLDVAVLQADWFFANQLTKSFEGNISQTLKTLKKKKIIEADKEGHNARYRFTSSAFKAYLRFHKGAILRDIISPSRPLEYRRQ